jgi:hypothetical protein
VKEEETIGNEKIITWDNVDVCLLIVFIDIWLNEIEGQD